ncbi:MAG TPA: antibiotic biosynthesis monooxygenase [Terriglobales bacterium]|nr:antibiotic biosynthesis monooxygenase [Terriglobales bacterium]
MAFVSITRLRVRSWLYLPMFALYALKSAREAARADGNLTTQLLRDRHNTFWTGTVWTSDAAMKRFMLAGAHRKAMNKLSHWCDEAALVHWTQERAELSTWQEAWTRLQCEGRPSKVTHPSPTHIAHRFPEPRVRPVDGLRFK